MIETAVSSVVIILFFAGVLLAGLRLLGAAFIPWWMPGACEVPIILLFVGLLVMAWRGDVSF